MEENGQLILLGLQLQDFGMRLKSLRLSKGISQQKLAEMSGVAASTIRRMEDDKDVPKLDTVYKVILSLGYKLNLSML